MARATLNFTYYERKDPVTGEVGSFVRKGTARQTSRRLKEFQQCVASGMRGFKAQGATPRERSLSVQNRFTTVAKGC